MPLPKRFGAFSFGMTSLKILTRENLLDKVSLLDFLAIKSYKNLAVNVIMLSS